MTTNYYYKLRLCTTSMAQTKCPRLYGIPPQNNKCSEDTTYTMTTKRKNHYDKDVIGKAFVRLFFALIPIQLIFVLLCYG